MNKKINWGFVLILIMIIAGIIGIYFDWKDTKTIPGPERTVTFTPPPNLYTPQPMNVTSTDGKG